MRALRDNGEVTRSARGPEANTLRSLILTTLTVAAALSAAPPDASAQASAREAAGARAAVRRANAAWARGEWERARSDYAAAWRVSRAPSLARRLARLHERLGEPHLAARWYARSLEAKQRSGTPPTPEERARLARLRASRPTTGSLSILASPRGASVHVDGVPFSPRTARVRAGDRRVVVEAPGHRPRADIVRVPAGARVARAYTLEPLPAARSRVGRHEARAGRHCAPASAPSPGHPRRRVDAGRRADRRVVDDRARHCRGPRRRRDRDQRGGRREHSALRRRRRRRSRRRGCLLARRVLLVVEQITGAPPGGAGRAPPGRGALGGRARRSLIGPTSRSFPPQSGRDTSIAARLRKKSHRFHLRRSRSGRS